MDISKVVDSVKYAINLQKHIKMVIESDLSDNTKIIMIEVLNSNVKMEMEYNDAEDLIDRYWMDMFNDENISFLVKYNKIDKTELDKIYKFVEDNKPEGYDDYDNRWMNMANSGTALNLEEIERIIKEVGLR